MNKKIILGFLAVILVTSIAAGAYAYFGEGVIGKLTGKAVSAQSAEMEKFRTNMVYYLTGQLLDYRQTKLAYGMDFNNDQGARVTPSSLYDSETLRSNVFDSASKLEEFYNSTTSVLRLDNNISVASGLGRYNAIEYRYGPQGTPKAVLRLSPVEQKVGVAGYYSYMNRMKMGFMTSVEVVHSIDLLLGERSFDAAGFVTKYPNTLKVLPETKSHFLDVIKQTSIPEDGLTMNKLVNETTEILSSWQNSWAYEIFLLDLGEAIYYLENSKCHGNTGCVVKGSEIKDYLTTKQSSTRFVNQLINPIVEENFSVSSLIYETRTNLMKNRNLRSYLEAAYPWIVGKQFREKMSITDLPFQSTFPYGRYSTTVSQVREWINIEDYRTYPVGYKPEIVDESHVRTALMEQLKANRENLFDYMGVVENGLLCVNTLDISSTQNVGNQMNPAGYFYSECKDEMKKALDKSPPAPRFERFPVNDSRSIKYMFANYYLDLVEDAKQIQEARDEADSTTKHLIIGTALVVGGVVSGPISSISMLYRGSLAASGPIQGAVGVATLAGNAVYTGYGVHNAYEQCSEIIKVNDVVHVGRRMIPDPQNPDKLIPNPINLGPQDMGDLSNCVMIWAFTALDLAGVVGIPPFITKWFGSAKEAAEQSKNYQRMLVIDEITKTHSGDIIESMLDVKLNPGTVPKLDKALEDFKLIGGQVEESSIKLLPYSERTSGSAIASVTLSTEGNTPLNELAKELRDKLNLDVVAVRKRTLGGASGRYVDYNTPGVRPRIEIDAAELLAPKSRFMPSLLEFAESGNSAIHDTLHAVLTRKLREDGIAGTGLLVAINLAKKVENRVAYNLGYPYLVSQEVLTQGHSRFLDGKSYIKLLEEKLLKDPNPRYIDLYRIMIENVDSVDIYNANKLAANQLVELYTKAREHVLAAERVVINAGPTPNVRFSYNAEEHWSIFEFESGCQIKVNHRLSKDMGQEYLDVYFKNVLDDSVLSVPFLDTDTIVGIADLEKSAIQQGGRLTAIQERDLRYHLADISSELQAAEKIYQEGIDANLEFANNMEKLRSDVEEIGSRLKYPMSENRYQIFEYELRILKKDIMGLYESNGRRLGLIKRLADLDVPLQSYYDKSVFMRFKDFSERKDIPEQFKVALEIPTMPPRDTLAR